MSVSGEFQRARSRRLGPRLPVAERTGHRRGYSRRHQIECDRRPIQDITRASLRDVCLSGATSPESRIAVAFGQAPVLGGVRLRHPVGQVQRVYAAHGNAGTTAQGRLKTTWGLIGPPPNTTTLLSECVFVEALRSGLIRIYANAAVALCVNALGVGSLARSGIHCKSEVVEVVGELVGVDVHGRDGR